MGLMICEEFFGDSFIDCDHSLFNPADGRLDDHTKASNCPWPANFNHPVRALKTTFATFSSDARS